MAAQVTAGTKAGADVNTLSCDIKSRPPSPLRKPLSTDSEIKRQLRQPEDAKDALENGTQEDGKWDIFRAVRGDHGPERHDDHRRRARDDARARAECDVGHTPMTTNDHKPTSGSLPPGQRLRSPRTRWAWRGARSRPSSPRARPRSASAQPRSPAFNRSAACTHNSSSRRDMEVVLRRLRLDKNGARACAVQRWLRPHQDSRDESQGEH